MNGVHDMGGMDGFGPVVREPNEPVFHAEWEGRVYAIASIVAGLSLINADEFRHAIERIAPERYLASSYYERWLAAVETLLVERGVVTREEILAKQDGAIDPALIANPVATQGPAPVKDQRGSRPPRARYAKGARVRARNLNPSGHTRLPRYARGKAGVIARDLGRVRLPRHQRASRRDQAATLLFGRVRRARVVGQISESDSRERVYLDLWEDYLEPIAAKPKRQTTKRKTAQRYG